MKITIHWVQSMSIAKSLAGHRHTRVVRCALTIWPHTRLSLSRWVHKHAQLDKSTIHIYAMEGGVGWGLRATTDTSKAVYQGNKRWHVSLNRNDHCFPWICWLRVSGTSNRHEIVSQSSWKKARLNGSITCPWTPFGMQTVGLDLIFRSLPADWMCNLHRRFPAVRPL